MPNENQPQDMSNRNIWWLAITSFFNDIASEATLRLFPLFLSQVLGANQAIVGLVEGIAESTATLTKLLSGWVSDRLPRRKPLVVAGYAFSGLTKPLLLLANAWPFALFIRFADRLGKGMRASPRDALVADLSHESKRGHNFGVLSALDTLGAVTGLSIAYLVVHHFGIEALTRDTYRTIVLIAIVPAALSVLTVTFGVREKPRAIKTPAAVGEKTRSWSRLPARYWRYVAIVALFTLSNSSDAFLVLRASESKGGVAFVLICLLVLNVSTVVIAVPAGRLSDRIERRWVIATGWLIYAVAYAGFAYVPPSATGVMLLLFFFYGSFYGFTGGVERSLIADMVSEGEARGLAYGIFNFVVGLMSFPASLIFGLVATRMGEHAAFLMDAALATISIAGLFLTR